MGVAFHRQHLSFQNIYFDYSKIYCFKTDTQNKQTNKHTSTLHTISLPHMTLIFLNIYIRTTKSHPQPQNLMWNPVAVVPDLLLSFPQQQPGTLPSSFSKPQSCHGSSATESTVPSLYKLTFGRDYLRKNLSTQLF